MPWVVILNWIMSEARETRPIAVLKALALCDKQRQNKSLQPSFKKASSHFAAATLEFALFFDIS